MISMVIMIESWLCVHKVADSNKFIISVISMVITIEPWLCVHEVAGSNNITLVISTVAVVRIFVQKWCGSQRAISLLFSKELQSNPLYQIGQALYTDILQPSQNCVVRQDLHSNLVTKVAFHLLCM